MAESLFVTCLQIVPGWPYLLHVVILLCLSWLIAHGSDCYIVFLILDHFFTSEY